MSDIHAGMSTEATLHQKSARIREDGKPKLRSILALAGCGPSQTHSTPRFRWHCRTPDITHCCFVLQIRYSSTHPLPGQRNYHSITEALKPYSPSLSQVTRHTCWNFLLPDATRLRGEGHPPPSSPPSAACALPAAAIAPPATARPPTARLRTPYHISLTYGVACSRCHVHGIKCMRFYLIWDRQTLLRHKIRANLALWLCSQKYGRPAQVLLINSRAVEAV